MKIEKKYFYTNFLLVTYERLSESLLYNLSQYWITYFIHNY